MAKYEKNNVVFGDNTEIPTGVYTVLITDMRKRVSSNGNPMIETAGEICDPPTVSVNGKTVQVAGRRLRNWFNILDPSSPYGVGRLVAGLQRAGLNPTELQQLGDGEIFDDSEELLKVFVGKKLRMRVVCRPNKLMRPPTEEEKAAGKTDYVPLTDPVSGKELSSGYQLETSWGDVVGPAEEGGLPY